MVQHSLNFLLFNKKGICDILQFRPLVDFRKEIQKLFRNFSESDVDGEHQKLLGQGFEPRTPASVGH